MGFIGDAVGDVVGGIGDAVGGVVDAVGDVVGDVVEGVASFGKDLISGELFGGGPLGFIASIGLSMMLPGVGQFISGMFPAGSWAAKAVQAISSVGQSIGSGFEFVTDKIGSVFDFAATEAGAPLGEFLGGNTSALDLSGGAEIAGGADIASSSVGSLAGDTSGLLLSGPGTGLMTTPGGMVANSEVNNLVSPMGFSTKHGILETSGQVGSNGLMSKAGDFIGDVLGGLASPLQSGGGGQQPQQPSINQMGSNVTSASGAGSTFTEGVQDDPIVTPLLQRTKQQALSYDEQLRRMGSGQGLMNPRVRVA